MNILVAFDKFKDSMSATRACDAAVCGAQKAIQGDISFTSAPLTDGGEGFCRILTEAASGYIEYHPVTGPLGEEIDAPLGWVNSDDLPVEAKEILGVQNGSIAIIEMASVAGLELVPKNQRHPGHCTTKGVGELIRVATSKDASAILLGLGGSITSDLGLGALEALGINFVNTQSIVPGQWGEINGVSGKIDIETPPILIACDVGNPLLGANGAAYVYGPQKGLAADEIETFDASAKKMATLLCGHFEQPENLKDTPGSGAAGGIGFGLKVACGATYKPGFELVAAWLQIKDKVEKADLILTGEGKFDSSSLEGKGPYSLLATADSASKPVIVLAGCLEDDAVKHAGEKFEKVYFRCISPEGMDLEEALAKGPENLERSVETILYSGFEND